MATTASSVQALMLLPSPLMASPPLKSISTFSTDHQHGRVKNEEMEGTGGTDQFECSLQD